MKMQVPVEISSTFFFDEQFAASDLRGRSLQELQGHMVLMHSENAFELKLSALVDGNTIDFLFGSKGMANSAELKDRVRGVKGFLRELNHNQQYQCCLFYYALMKEIKSFQEAMDSPFSVGFGRSKLCLCFQRDKQNFNQKVNEAYIPFYRSIYALKQ